MNTRFGLEFPPWSCGPPAGEFLDRAVGELGLTQISVPAVTGPVAEFRSDPPGGPHHFESGGGWHFRSAREWSGRTLKPRLAEGIGKGNVIEKLAGECQERGLQVHLRMDVRGGLLARPGRGAARVNAWNEPMPGTGVCSCNPGVRELLRETMVELETYGPAAIELMHWDIDAWDRDRLAAKRNPGRHHRQMCFCAACRQIALSAGLDPDLAARSLRVHLESERSSEAEDDFVRDDPVIRAFADTVQEDQRRWLEQTCRKSATTKYVIWDGEPSGPVGAHARPFVLLSDARLEVGDDETDNEACRSAPAVAVAVDDGHFTEAQALVQFSHDWVSRYKPELFQFRGLDRISRARLDWVKQAVRYARREAG